MKSINDLNHWQADLRSVRTGVFCSVHHVHCLTLHWLLIIGFGQTCPVCEDTLPSSSEPSQPRNLILLWKVSSCFLSEQPTVWRTSEDRFDRNPQSAVRDWRETWSSWNWFIKKNRPVCFYSEPQWRRKILDWFPVWGLFPLRRWPPSDSSMMSRRWSI